MLRTRFSQREQFCKGVVSIRVAIKFCPKFKLKIRCVGDCCGVSNSRFYNIRIRVDRLVIFIFCNLRIIKHGSHSFEDLQRLTWCDVEKLTILANAQICQAVYRLMHGALHLGILHRFQGCIDFKRQGHSGVVQLFGADIHRARAFTDFHPILLKTRIGQDIYIASFFHRVCSLRVTKLLIFRNFTNPHR